jgi:hypothetical protein
MGALRANSRVRCTIPRLAANRTSLSGPTSLPREVAAGLPKHRGSVVPPIARVDDRRYCARIDEVAVGHVADSPDISPLGTLPMTLRTSAVVAEGPPIATVPAALRSCSRSRAVAPRLLHSCLGVDAIVQKAPPVGLLDIEERRSPSHTRQHPHGSQRLPSAARIPRSVAGSADPLGKPRSNDAAQNSVDAGLLLPGDSLQLGPELGTRASAVVMIVVHFSHAAHV